MSGMRRDGQITFYLYFPFLCESPLLFSTLLKSGCPATLLSSHNIFFSALLTCSLTIFHSSFRYQISIIDHIMIILITCTFITTCHPPAFTAPIVYRTPPPTVIDTLLFLGPAFSRGVFPPYIILIHYPFTMRAVVGWDKNRRSSIIQYSCTCRGGLKGIASSSSGGSPLSLMARHTIKRGGGTFVPRGTSVTLCPPLPSPAMTSTLRNKFEARRCRKRNKRRNAMRD